MTMSPWRHPPFRNPSREIHPFVLTPDRALHALEEVGLRGDGRFRRLVQLRESGLPGAAGGRQRRRHQVLPAGRWSQLEIQEEHDFRSNWRWPRRPPSRRCGLVGVMLHQFGGFMFSVSPRRGGRAPELDNAEALELDSGRFRPASTWSALRRHLAPAGAQSLADLRCCLCVTGGPIRLIFAGRCSARADMSARALELVDRHDCLAARSPARGEEPIRLLRSHGDCHPGICGLAPTQPRPPGPGLHFVDLDDLRVGGPAVQDRGCCSRETGTSVSTSSAHWSTVTSSSGVRSA